MPDVVWILTRTPDPDPVAEAGWVLRSARAVGFTVRAAAGKLLVGGAALTDEWRAAFRDCKAPMLLLLEQEEFLADAERVPSFEELPP